MNFPIPSPPKVNLYRMQDFLGVDFSSAPASVDDRRSPDAYNFMHVDGQNVKRNGFDLVHSFVDAFLEPLGPINGMMQLADGTLVHVGTALYLWDGTTATELDLYGVLGSSLANNKSFFLNFNGETIIFDGTAAWKVRYDSVSEVYVGEQLSSAYPDYAPPTSYPDDVAYVPTTCINRTYGGSASTVYEAVNILTPWRINSFVGSSTSTTYLLDAVSIDSDLINGYTLNANGTWTTWKEYTGIGSDSGTVTVNRTTGVVTFKTAPGVTPISGVNNVRVRFAKTTDDYVDRINKCTFASTFGTNGNNNRIFASGNPDYPNTEWYCELYDPTYWPDLNYAQVGVPSSAIVGYTRVGNAQAGIHKATNTGDQGVYYRTGTYSDTLSDDVFYYRSGYTDVEMLTPHTSAVLEGEPIFLSSLGVHAMIPRDQLTTSEYVLPNRSFYINNRLTQESNLENAVALTIGDRYYLAINDHIYVADGQYKYYDARIGKRQAQYEWYYWKDIPATCLCDVNGTLYFGDSTGNIYKFVEDQYWDYIPEPEEEEGDPGEGEIIEIEFGDGNPNHRPVDLLWTCPLKSMNTVTQRKTIRRTVAIAQPNSLSHCTIGYVLDGTEIPIKEVDPVAESPTIRAIVSKKSIRKFNYVQLYFKSSDMQSGGLYAIEIQYTFAGNVRR